MSNDEASKTLTALEKLICVAELLGLSDPAQRAVLQALRGRRAVLKRMIASQRRLKAQKIVCLGAWRDAAPLAAQRRLQPV